MLALGLTCALPDRTGSAGSQFRRNSCSAATDLPTLPWSLSKSGSTSGPNWFIPVEPTPTDIAEFGRVCPRVGQIEVRSKLGQTRPKLAQQLPDSGTFVYTSGHTWTSLGKVSDDVDRVVALLIAITRIWPKLARLSRRQCCIPTKCGDRSAAQAQLANHAEVGNNPGAMSPERPHQTSAPMPTTLHDRNIFRATLPKAKCEPFARQPSASRPTGSPSGCASLPQRAKTMLCATSFLVPNHRT